MTLSSNDYKQLLELIDTTHSYFDRSAMFEAVCEKLGDLIGLNGAAFIPVDPGTGRFFFPGHLAFNSSDKTLLLFSIYYAPLHPVVTRELQLNEPISMAEIIPESRMEEVLYGHDFELKTPPFYEFCCRLSSSEEVVGVLGFHRRENDSKFSDRDREIIRLFLPHLSKAFHNLELVETVNSALEIGLIVTGADEQPLYMNEAAKKVINDGPIESILNPGSSSRRPFFESENGRYRVRIVPTHPDGNEKVVMLEPFQGSGDIRGMLKCLDLSRQQIEVAHLAICGLCNKEIAGRLYISEQTVKDHLRNIFEKIHVHSRGELTAKVLGLHP